MLFKLKKGKMTDACGMHSAADAATNLIESDENLAVKEPARFEFATVTPNSQAMNRAQLLNHAEELRRQASEAEALAWEKEQAEQEANLAAAEAARPTDDLDGLSKGKLAEAATAEGVEVHPGMRKDEIARAVREARAARAG